MLTSVMTYEYSTFILLDVISIFHGNSKNNSDTLMVRMNYLTGTRNEEK